MKKIIFFLSLITLLVLTPNEASAQQKASVSSAKIQPLYTGNIEGDNRVKILEAYLRRYNSPLADNAEDFVRYADKYDLDWRFVASIAGLESSFGQRIPTNSYNAWGWGVYGDNVHYFTSWEEGIKVISHGLRTRYMDQWGAEDIYEIGSFYAASPTWAQRVTFFMNNIQSYALKNPKESLSLSI